MSTRIVFNGRAYRSREAMPADVRDLYDQTLAMVEKSGGVLPTAGAVPTGAPPGSQSRSVLRVKQTTFVVNGTRYDSVEAMPADVRQTYLKAIAQLDANHNGIPDSLEPGRGRSTSASGDAALGKAQIVYSTTIGGRASSTRLIGVLLGIIAILLALLLRTSGHH